MNRFDHDDDDLTEDDDDDDDFVDGSEYMAGTAAADMEPPPAAEPIPLWAQAPPDGDASSTELRRLPDGNIAVVVPADRYVGCAVEALPRYCL